MRQLSLFVTSRCNLNCDECIMGHLMRHRSYEMSLEELEALLETSEQSSYVFEFILTGGEPLIWRNIRPGLKMLKQSKVAGRVRVFSNAVNIHGVDDELMSSVDELRISRYQLNQRNIDQLKDRYPQKVNVVERTGFWPNPRQPLSDVLPARCLNYHQHLYYDHKVYACPHSESIALACGVKGARLFTPLHVGFIPEIDGIFREQQPYVCTLCIANGKVRDRLRKSENTNNYTRLMAKGRTA